jgi:hypothetical protein
MHFAVMFLFACNGRSAPCVGESHTMCLLSLLLQRIKGLAEPQLRRFHASFDQEVGRKTTLTEAISQCSRLFTP